VARLTLGQAIDLLDRHGSVEAACRARPDLASDLRRFDETIRRSEERQMQQQAELRRWRERFYADSAAIIEQLREQAPQREARPYSGKPGRPMKPIHTATANRVVRLLKQGELSLRAIAEQTGLSRYQVTKIRDDLSGRK
jgi:hypothetical protein